MPLLPDLDLFLSVEIADAARDIDEPKHSEFSQGYKEGWLDALQMVKEWCVKEGLVA